MSRQYIKVIDTHDGQLREIRLNAPPANILTAAMMAEIAVELERAQDAANLKLLMICGAGNDFSYGASVEEHRAESVTRMLPAFHRLIESIMDLPLPTLAKVQGRCLGGGFELALACSLLVAESGAQFAVPEIQLGVFPPVAAALLPPGPGARMILSGSVVTACQLERMGLVALLAKPGTLDATVNEHVQAEILPHSASSLRVAHRALRLGQLDHFRRVIHRLEALYLDELMATHDALEGISSFIERRQPQWSNS